MLLYGVAKLFPIQFGPLGPHTLDATIGEASRQQVLWYFMGVSAPYAFAGGVAEVVGGMLLFWRRTALLGALIVAMVMTNVVLLNFCYDVCVKQYSSHLLLMTGFLLAPDARRVLDYLGRGGRDAAPSHLFTSRRTQLMAAVSRGVLICSVWLSLANFVRSAYDNGRIGSASKPPYHGTWLVERFERASTLVPACASEARRWERVLIENHIFTTVTMDRTRRSYRFDYDAGKSTLALKDREATFGTLHAAGSGSELRLHGVLVDDDIQVALRRVPESQFRPLEPLQWIHERSD
jgi:hypothetical protein